MVILSHAVSGSGYHTIVVEPLEELISSGTMRRGEKSSGEAFHHSTWCVDALLSLQAKPVGVWSVRDLLATALSKIHTPRDGGLQGIIGGQ